MLNRFYPIDEPDVDLLFSRDADSRINERDQFVISEFIKSNKMFHIVRDHYEHKFPILGGIFGVKKGCIIF